VFVAIATLLVLGVVPAVDVAVTQAQAAPTRPLIETATTKPPPPKAMLKVCEVSNAVPVGTTFTFTVNSGPPLTVPSGLPPGGYCTLVGPRTVGSTATIVEAPLLVVLSITTNALGPVTTDLGSRTITVTIGTGVTEVTFTDGESLGGAVPFLEICKHTDPYQAIPYSVLFAFTVGTSSVPVMVPAGACSPPLVTNTGHIKVTEQPSAEFQMTGCTIFPANRIVSCSPGKYGQGGTAVVDAGGPNLAGESILTFNNLCEFPQGTSCPAP